MEIRLDSRLYDYKKFQNFNCLTPYDDLTVGEVYHIPPTILYGRRDVYIMEKTDKNIRGVVTYYDDGRKIVEQLFRSEISMKFLVKKETK